MLVIKYHGSQTWIRSMTVVLGNGSQQCAKVARFGGKLLVPQSYP